MVFFCILDDVMSIWVIGVLQEGSEGKSEWLDLFSLKDLEVLQYANDLKVSFLSYKIGVQYEI